jgi:hypothetical protein
MVVITFDDAVNDENWCRRYKTSVRRLMEARSCIRSTSFSSLLKNGHDKLVWLSLTGLSSLPGTNTLACWAHYKENEAFRIRSVEPNREGYTRKVFTYVGPVTFFVNRLRS